MVQLYNFSKMAKNAIFRGCSPYFLKNVTWWEVFEARFVFSTKKRFGNTRYHLISIKKIKICRAVLHWLQIRIPAASVGLQVPFQHGFHTGNIGCWFQQTEIHFLGPSWIWCSQWFQWTNHLTLSKINLTTSPTSS